MQITARWNRPNIQKIKNKHGIPSDRKLAQGAGIAPNTLHHQLTHDRPTIETLVALSVTYGIAIDHLIHKTGMP